MEPIALGFLFLALAVLLLFRAIPVLAITAILFVTVLWRSARWAFRFAAAAVLAGYFLATPALASAAAAAGTFLSVPPAFWDEVNALIIGTIVAVLGLLVKWLLAHIKLKSAQAQQIATDLFQNLLDKGAQYGATQLAAAEQNVGAINVGNAGVAAAANFVIAHGPDLAKKVGVDVTTEDGRAAVIRSVTLRIGQVLADGPPPPMPLPASVTPPAN